MFRVDELFFVESQAAWAVALAPDLPTRKLEVGDELLAGQRVWKVTEIHPAPLGLVGARLDGPSLVTRGLIMRPRHETMGDLEFKAASVLLVRLARAMRAVDVDGILVRLEKKHMTVDAEDLTAAERALAKSALMAKHFIQHGATDEELTIAAKTIGIGGEL